MSDVVQMKKIEKPASKSKQVNDFLKNNHVLLAVILAVIVLGVIGYTVVFNIYTNGVKTSLDKIEVIEYTLTKDAADITDESLIAQRQDTALSNVEPFLQKSGIVGARAGMLAADIYMQRSDWEKSRDLWLMAASKCKGSYLESLCSFNAANCLEELGENEKALECYTAVANDKEFLDRSRAWFSAGRIKEVLGDWEGAKAVYESIASLEYSSD